MIWQGTFNVCLIPTTHPPEKDSLMLVRIGV
jgi:hypothetical protein